MKQFKEDGKQFITTNNGNETYFYKNNRWNYYNRAIETDPKEWGELMDSPDMMKEYGIKAYNTIAHYADGIYDFTIYAFTNKPNKSKSVIVEYKSLCSDKAGKVETESFYWARGNGKMPDYILNTLVGLYGEITGTNEHNPVYEMKFYLKQL